MNLEIIHKSLTGLQPAAALTWLTETYPDLVAFSTSFGYEDQVIADIIFRNNLPVKVFTLDTGRHFPETYSVWNATLSRYNERIHTYFPKADAVEALLESKGPNSFYQSIENRKECCYLRKVEPLQRALQGQQIWITGIRAEQSPNRKDMQPVEWDKTHQLVKFHPLFHWTFEQVKGHISKYNIPYNALHDRGFPSIGCQPCTRAVESGEDPRAGRWWWEQTNAGKKECGLHS